MRLRVRIPPLQLQATTNLFPATPGHTTADAHTRREGQQEHPQREADVIRIPDRPLARAEVDAAVASLRTVGGVYDLIAEVVEQREGARAC